MLDSIYIGLSGMDAYSKGLQIISNNVANLNTLGFKADTATFSDFYNTSNSTDNSGQDGSGSPSQGAGVRSGSSLVDFSQGDLQQSNGDLDLAVQGRGFLVLKSADGQAFYGQTGQFAVDGQGYISTANGVYRLTVIDPATKQPTTINVNQLATSPPAATTKVTFSDNLSSTGTTADVPNITVYDGAGGKHTWDVKFTAVGSTAPNTWTVTVTDENGDTLATSTLKFAGNAVDPTTQTISVSSTPAGSPPLTVDLDFSQNVTSFSAGTTSTLKAASVDGRGPGQLDSVTLDNTGNLQAGYTNGQSAALGAVALADFSDPQQLVRATGGPGLFTAPSTLKPQLLTSGDARVGSLVSKELQASNVDLTGQFGQLILIQRGYQACSQVLSVSNDMIQQLFGIRGQG